jgi:hypothetical protein
MRAMGLPDQLHALGARLGTTVFDDADSFRGALDDYLDEGAATTGEINLLVDTVRLGAYQRLVTMIDSGADPGAAVASAGELLARERGSADLAGSRWACAVLGFAADKIPAGEVERYYQGTQRAPEPHVPPTASPPQAPPTTSPAQTPPTTSPAQAPPTTSPAQAPPTASTPGVPPTAARPLQFQHGPAGDQVPPTAQAGGGGYRPPGHPGPQSPSPYAAAAPPKKHTPWGIIVAATVVVLALVAGGLWWVLPRGDGNNNVTDDPVETVPTTPGASTPTTVPTTTSASPPDDPFSFEAVTARYAPVAPSLGDILFECESAATAIGEVEHLNCTGADGLAIELVTLDTQSSLDNRRAFVVDNEVGSIYGVVDGRAYYRENPQAEGSTASLYWDDAEALQSVHLRGGSPKQLQSALTTVEAPVSAPTQPSDQDLRRIMSENLATLSRCKRVENVDRGQLEINRCRDSGLYIYYSRYPDMRELLQYRRAVTNISRNNDGTVNPWSYTGSTDVTEGRRIEWVDTEFDYAHLYWDVESCYCAVEAIALNDNQTRLYNWWLNE